MPNQPGQSLLHFLLVEEIGAGAMGTVWKATDITLDRHVAVKVLPDALATDPHLIARFQREAKLLASLNHPNLAAVYGVHNAEGTRFLAMELVPGEDLSERLVRGRLRAEDAIPIASRIADAVEAAHTSGVIHRDLKPANVRLTPDGRVKVLDFGLAKAVSTGATAREDPDPTADLAETKAGVVLGTAPYMSPEQARGMAVDGRSDIWSFGCLLFECLTGERPFRGETVSDLIGAILHVEPDFTRLPADTPAGVVRVLRRCLTKDPRMRLHNVADARIELECALTETGPENEPPRAQPRLGLATGALAATVIVVSALLLLALSRNEGGPPPAGNPLADPLVIRKLTNFPGIELDAAISPDGRFVAFVSDRDGPLDVLLGQIGGSGTFRNLTNGSERGDLNLQSRLRQVGFLGNEALWLGEGFAERLKRNDDLYDEKFRSYLNDEVVNVAVSPDGTRVAYHHGIDGDPVYVVDGSGAEPQPLLDSPRGYHQHYPAWSPDGRWIYLSRGTAPTGEMDLWRIRLDDRKLERLTVGMRYLAYPTPIDDRTVLFVAEEADGAGPWLWYLDLESGIPHRAAIGPERYSSVAASADGRRLVVTTFSPEAGLYSVPILEGEATEDDVEPLSPGSVRALSPRVRGEDLYYLSSGGAGDGLWRSSRGQDPIEVWPGRDGVLLEPAAISPDGSRVALIQRKEGRSRLNVVDADGGQSRVLADDVDVHGAADWSPSGEWLVVGGSDGERSGLVKIHAADGRWEIIHEGAARNPVWSPDGELIVFAGEQVNAYTKLLAVRPNRRPVELPEVEVVVTGEQFRFRPDGRLVFVKDQDFHLLDLATTGPPRRLTRLDAKATVHTFDISPDGARIVFDRRSKNSDIVLIERGGSR